MIRVLVIALVGGCVDELPDFDPPQIHRCELRSTAGTEVRYVCTSDGEQLAVDLYAECEAQRCLASCTSTLTPCTP